jgi:hypothetical protein
MARKRFTMKRNSPWLRFQNLICENTMFYILTESECLFLASTILSYIISIGVGRGIFCTWIINFTSLLINGQNNCKKYEEIIFEVV